ncbi:MAG: choline-sulfatase [Hyphomicrobiales bacterium]|nr:choline-sulfatase [Hyphomicrobiales bacterium]
MKGRLNMLIVMADQLAPSALPFHSGPAKAPHMEALAAQGVIFDAAYCNSPLCSPSRVSFMTGRLPSRHGVYDNAAEFHSDIPTFAHHLRCVGYRTVLAGKMHFCGADQLHGFEQRLTTDIYPADFGWTPDWDHPHTRPGWYHDMSSVIQAGICLRSNQIDYDEEVAFAAERLIYDHVRGTDERPLCLVVSLTHPHDPFAIPEHWWKLYADAEIPLPRVLPESIALHPHEERLRHVCDMVGAKISQDDVRRARHAYYGAISYVDDHLGRLLRALDASGLARDTLVIVTSDHGEMLGERGFWYKMSFFDGAARVPLIVHSPGRFAQRRVASAVSLVDILPTLVEIGRDGDLPRSLQDLDGRSLLPHLAGGAGHDEALGEYLAEGAIAPIVMIRRARHKFVFSPPDPDQLYDVAADPDERLNLAETPQFQELRFRLRDEVSSRWDVAALDRAVRESQHRRHLVTAALAMGTRTSWDYQPPRDTSREYIRNHSDLGALEARARFPAARRTPE